MQPEWREYRGEYERFTMRPAKISTNTFVQLYVLHLLSSGRHMYGYEIIKEMGDRFAGTTGWTPSPSVVYPILRKLTELGWLYYEKEDPMVNSRKWYHITQDGYKAYERMKAENRQKFKQSIELLTRAYQDVFGSD